MLGTLVVEFLAVAIGIFLFTYLQNIAQTYASERVASDLRTKLVAKLSTQDLAYIQRVDDGHAADEPDLRRRRREAVRLAGGRRRWSRPSS